MLLALYETSAPSVPSAGFSLFWVNIAAAALVLCLLLAGLLVWGLAGLFLSGIKNPVVWRLLAAPGMAVGSGLIVAAATCEPIPFCSPAGIIGIGAGILTGAITLLVLSFVGRRPG
jgi:hypothetical protein